MLKRARDSIEDPVAGGGLMVTFDHHLGLGGASCGAGSCLRNMQLSPLWQVRSQTERADARAGL